MYPFQDVCEKLTDNMLIWHKRFQQADRCKKLAYWLGGFSSDPLIIAKYDKRMNFIWGKVTEVEPFTTFVNGTLTSKASYYLNGISILQATGQI